MLEIGGGIGAAQVELLRRGVERTTNIELSPGYEEVALGLAREEGVDERIERRIGDAVTTELPDADAVLLNRVVCCYPDYEALLAVSASHARRFLVFTFPRSGAIASAVVGRREPAAAARAARLPRLRASAGGARRRGRAARAPARPRAARARVADRGLRAR